MRKYWHESIGAWKMLGILAGAILLILTIVYCLVSVDFDALDAYLKRPATSMSIGEFILIVTLTGILYKSSK